MTQGSEIWWLTKKKGLLYTTGVGLFCMLAFLQTSRFHSEKVFSGTIAALPPLILEDKANTTSNLGNTRFSGTLKYVAMGADINCKETTLLYPAPSGTVHLHQMDRPSKRDTFAYVWYATSSAYLCSALVAMKQLQNIRRSR